MSVRYKVLRKAGGGNMSITFAIATGGSITFGELKRLINVDRFLDSSIPPADEAAPVTGINHFYIEDVSCRAIEVSHTIYGYSISIKSASSLDDWKLGLKVTAAIASFFQAKIEGDGDLLTLEQFEQKYDNWWTKRQFVSGVDFALNQAHQHSGIVMMDGVTREFHLGERMAKEILNGRSKDEARAEFVRRFRQCQRIEPEYFVPKEYYLKASKKRFVIFGPGVSLVVPFVHYLALPEASSKNLIYVAHSLLPSLAPNLTWLDEKQALVDAIPESDWTELLKVARPHAVNLTPSIEEGGVAIMITRARAKYDALLNSTNGGI